MFPTETSALLSVAGISRRSPWIFENRTALKQRSAGCSMMLHDMQYFLLSPSCKLVRLDHIKWLISRGVNHTGGK